MPTLWRYSNSKNPGLLTLYILFSLKKKPKSGYEILTELREKGGKDLSPSKGSLYPLLKSLEANGHIRLERKGARSKNIYGITAKGNKLLTDFRREKKTMYERFYQYQKLFADILGENKIRVISLLLEMRKVALEKSNEKVINKLHDCLNKIKKL